MYACKQMWHRPTQACSRVNVCSTVAWYISQRETSFADLQSDTILDMASVRAATLDPSSLRKHVRVVAFTDEEGLRFSHHLPRQPRADWCAQLGS